ncbi:unnamed protein product [Rotaria sp. Silwood1]|nr:unnamed protein product [Rotaria sp. Silwood1]
MEIVTEMDPSVGIDNLVKPTIDMARLVVTPSNARQKHTEYLPYPDEKFIDESLQLYSLRDGPEFEWIIHKRYKHFHDLHEALVHYVERATGSDLSQRGANNDDSSSLNKKQDEQPCFPTRNDRLSFLNQFTIEERCKTLQNYLTKILKHPKFREHMATRDILDVSSLSFVQGLGISVKEGAIAKHSISDIRGRSIFLRVPFICDKLRCHHALRWFVLKDSYLVYMNSDSALIGFPLLIDCAFSFEQGYRKTTTNNGIKIKNSQRSMFIKFEKEDDRNTWFINGQSYMETVAKSILAAREDIFIAGWFISPELMLIRPCDDDSMRLVNLLNKRAEEGIRVYVLLFNDPPLVDLNSDHTESKLMAQSPTKRNIKVIRHPNHTFLLGIESSWLFSHHEKIVVIDQRIAFIGGIDLCWGRSWWKT